MKRKWKILSLAVVLLAIVSIAIFSNPLRRSEDAIRSRLLKDTPLGTQLADVHQYIVHKGWEIAYVSEDGGFLDQRVRPVKVVGEKSIRAEIGHYQGIPFKAYVTVFWGFDRDSRLIDIWVWKTWDAL